MSDQRAAQELAAVEKALLARWPETRMEPSTDRIRALVHMLGDPQQAYDVVHLTGTNGKTSTARMIDALLRGAGVRTGRFTSPHLESITERVSVDGEPISPERFVAAYRDIEPYLGLVDESQPHPLSFFETMVGLAYAFFADVPIDTAIIEVGLGGTWDATNVADGIVAVATPIALDHTTLLGNTVAEIATEKAGIIKPGATLVTAVQPEEAATVLLTRAVEVGATVAREGLEFGVLARRVAVGGQLLTLQGLGQVYEDVFLPLHGEYQASNAALALASAEALLGTGVHRALDADAVRSAFAGVSSPGRLEAVRAAPTVLVDAAHNPAGMRATVAALGDSFDFRNLVAVVGVLGDKDARGMLEILEAVADTIICTQNSSARSIAADELGEQAVDIFGADRVVVTPRLDDALEDAIRIAEESADDGPLAGAGVLVTGSVVTAGEARTLLSR